MKICGFGSKIIVEGVEADNSGDKNGFIVPQENIYSKGKIISMGSVIPVDLLSDDTLEEGSVIVYQTSKANPLGLEFPDNYFVVEAQDVVGVILEEEGDGE